MDDDAGGWLEARIGACRIAVSTHDPVAVLRRPGAEDLVVMWPDLDVGSRAVSITVVPAPTGVWVIYRPQESDDSTLPDGTAAAVHIAVTGQLTRFVGVDESQPLGATRHGLWVTSDHFPDPDDEAAWRGEHQTTVLGPGGGIRRVATDRRIAFVLDTAGSARIIAYAGAPTADRGLLGSVSYTHRYVALTLGDGLSDVMRSADVVAEQVDERMLLNAMTAATPQIPADEPPNPEVPWQRIRLSDAEIETAVGSALREFADLANYWHAQDGRAHPLSAGIADPVIEAVGEWPNTRVEVSFRHPHYPQGRLRRTLLVFDDAGRVRPAMYAAIHLMEDLDTGALPDAGAARNGILEI